MPIRVEQLYSEFQLVSHFDPPGVCILQTSRQGFGQVERTRELKPFRSFVYYF
jgi:hypothetical protein